MSDVHQHYCRQCRAPWEHDGEQMTDSTVLKAAHKCPSCGTSGYVKFYGNETHDEMCQLEALLELSEDERVPAHTQRQAERDFARMAQRLHRPNEPQGLGAWGLADAYQAGAGIEELLDMLSGFD